MFKNTKSIVKIVFINTNCIILNGDLAKSRFFSFLCSLKQLKQNRYEPIMVLMKRRELR